MPKTPAKTTVQPAAVRKPASKTALKPAKGLTPAELVVGQVTAGADAIEVHGSLSGLVRHSARPKTTCRSAAVLHAPNRLPSRMPSRRLHYRSRFCGAQLLSAVQGPGQAIIPASPCHYRIDDANHPSRPLHRQSPGRAGRWRHHSRC